MKVWELWEKLEIGQTASSPNDSARIVKKTDGLYWVDEGSSDTELVEFRGYTLCDDKWTIDQSWFHFEQALDAAKNHNIMIKSEHWGYWRDYEFLVTHGVNGEELTGLWLIKDK